MATTKKTTAPKTTTRRRARTDEGQFQADDPKTPDVNEAWEYFDDKAEEPKAEEPKVEEKPAPKAAAPKPAATVWFQSREKEPTMFPVAGIYPIRNFSNGRLEYEVPADDVARFEQNHFVMNARIVRKV